MLGISSFRQLARSCKEILEFKLTNHAMKTSRQDELANSDDGRMSKRKGVGSVSRDDDEIIKFLQSGIKEDAARYQDGAYRRPRGAVGFSVKNAAIVTLIALLLIIASVLYAVFSNSDTQERMANFLEEKYGISVSRSKDPICVVATDDSIKPVSIQQNDTIKVKYFIFSGRYNISEAVRICQTSPRIRGYLADVHTSMHDNSVYRLITDFSKTEFFKEDSNLVYGMRELLWTGSYIELDVDEGATIQFHGSKDKNRKKVEEYYQNFCEPRKVKIWERVKTYVDAWRKKRSGQPIIHIVKDFKDNKDGCWDMISTQLFDWSELKLHLVCQIEDKRFPYTLARETHPRTGEVQEGIFHGKLRGNETDRLADMFVIFNGRGNLLDAKERCQGFETNAAIVAPANLTEDFEINKLVEHHSMAMFGVDTGDPERKTLLWTDYYFNLSSKYPKTLRRWNDSSGVMDLPPPQEITEYAFQKVDVFKYENFCGTEELYMKMIDEAIAERKNKQADCNKLDYMVLAKDYRPGQATQGCWHLYDADYIEKHKIELYLMCKLPRKAKETTKIFKETSLVFNYDKKSREP